MYDLNDEFSKFLSNIEPDDNCVAQASEAHNEIRDYLKNEQIFKELFFDSFLSGSYKRHTAIKEIKDVDIIIVLNKDVCKEEPQEDIKDVFDKLKKSLIKKYDIEQIEQQRRSIKIVWKFKNEKDNESRQDALSLDIVPAIRSNDDTYEYLWIPDKELKKWIMTNPIGHIEKITEKNKKSNKICDRNVFVPFVKMLKFWKSVFYVVPKRPKGFLLECLAYNSFETNASNWFDCFKEGLEDILNKYEKYAFESEETIDFIEDIGMEKEYIHTSTTYSSFKKFIEKAKETLETMEQSQKCTNKYDCIKKIQKIFTEEYFPFPQESDKDIKNNEKETKQVISVFSGSSKNPEAKPYG